MAATDIRKACWHGRFEDGVTTCYGTSDDVTVQWDGTNMILTAAADDSLIEIGDSASTQKSFDLKWYANEASGASYLYFDASANNIYTTGVDLQFKDNDLLTFGTGSGATGDVQFVWDATDFHMKATANNSVFNIGDGTTSFDINIYGSAAANVQSFDASANKWVWGTTAAHIASATAGIIFDDRVHECSATSGSAYGFKQRMYITGAGGGGAAGRFYTLGYGVAAAGGYGIEGTFEYHAPTTTVTGLAAAGKFSVIAGVDATGTAAVLDLSFDVASGKTVQTNGSCFIRVGKTNSGTGSNVLFDFVDASGAAGAVTSLVCTDHANDITANLFARCLVAGTPAWILMTTTAPAAS